MSGSPFNLDDTISPRIQSPEKITRKEKKIITLDDIESALRQTNKLLFIQTLVLLYIAVGKGF